MAITKRKDSLIKAAKVRAAILAWVNSGATPIMPEIVSYPPVVDIGMKKAGVESIVWRLSNAGQLVRIRDGARTLYSKVEGVGAEAPAEKKEKPSKPGFTRPDLKLVVLKNGGVRLSINGLTIEIGVEK